MVQGPRHFKRSPRSTHTKAPVMFDYLVTAASAAAAYPNPPSNARCAASNCTELPGRMADFERKSAIRVHVTNIVRMKLRNTTAKMNGRLPFKVCQPKERR